MTSHKYYKLSAKPKWAAHADLARWNCEETPMTPLPVWRDKSLWRITTTKTVEGVLCEEPSRGVKKKIEGLHEALTHGVCEAFEGI